MKLHGIVMSFGSLVKTKGNKERGKIEEGGEKEKRKRGHHDRSAARGSLDVPAAAAQTTIEKPSGRRVSLYDKS